MTPHDAVDDNKEVQMSKLTFQRGCGRIIMTSADHKIVGVWKAHNKVSTGHQPFPDGRWQLFEYRPHLELTWPRSPSTEDCWSGHGFPKGFKDTVGIGCDGVFLFEVTDASGHKQFDFGVHAGRTEAPPHGTLNSIGGVTHGCIRVTPAAMLTIITVHAGGDPVREITVEP